MNYSHLRTNSSFGNNTAESSDAAFSSVFQTFVVLLCSLVIIVGVIGNSLVIIVFGMRYKKLKNCEIFMINLAVADLLGSVFVPVQHIVELTESSFHPIGHVGCQMLSWFSLACVTVSALTLLSISIDRFIIVKWPMRERAETWKMLCMILIIWCTSGLLGTPYFMNYRVRLQNIGNEKHVCRTFWQSEAEDHTHTLVVFIFQVALPISFMTTLYSLIIREIRIGSKTELFDTFSRMWQVRMKQQRAATWMMLIIVVAFYIFILPVNLFYITYTFGGITSSTQSIVYIFYFLQAWAMINASVNPIIYSKLHKSFRKNTLKLLWTCAGKKFSASSFRSMRSSFRTTQLSIAIRRRTASGSSRPDSLRSNRDSPRIPGTPTSPDFTESTRLTPVECCTPKANGYNGYHSNPLSPKLMNDDLNHNMHAQLLLRLHSSSVAFNNNTEKDDKEELLQ